MKAVDLVYQALSAKDLPVKFFGALAFSKALQLESLKPFILPNLQNILATYLTMMQAVEHESLIEALESIIISFNQEIHPYALELAQRIVTHYQNNRNDINNDDNGRSPVAYVQAICKIVMSVHKDQALISKLEVIIMPLIDSSLSPLGMEITDDCIECAIMLLSHGNTPVSPDMITLFSKFIKFV